MSIITGLIGSIPNNMYSHNAAYFRIWANLLDANIEKANFNDSGTVYVSFDINYSGTLNMFGGAGESFYNRLRMFLASDSRMIMLDHEMPKLGSMIESRIGNKSTFHKIDTEFCAALDKKCSTIKTLRMVDLVTDKLIIGDSHSMSMAPQGVPVFRHDGKTLHGALKDSFIEDQIPSTVREVTLMFGSIDIRHHLYRRQNPIESLEILLNNYISLYRRLEKSGLHVSICSPVPIETETRKMAKSTHFKEEPFSGTREDRLKLTRYFIEYLEKAKCSMIKYPEEWYSMDPRAFEQEIMERPRGIHIGYPNYRMNNFGAILGKKRGFFY